MPPLFVTCERFFIPVFEVQNLMPLPERHLSQSSQFLGENFPFLWPQNSLSTDFPFVFVLLGEWCSDEIRSMQQGASEEGWSFWSKFPRGIQIPWGSAAPRHSCAVGWRMTVLFYWKDVFTLRLRSKWKVCHSSQNKGVFQNWKAKMACVRWVWVAGHSTLELGIVPWFQKNGGRLTLLLMT